MGPGTMQLLNLLLVASTDCAMLLQSVPDLFGFADDARGYAMKHNTKNHGWH